LKVCAKKPNVKINKTQKTPAFVKYDNYYYSIVNKLELDDRLTRVTKLVRS